MVSILLNLEANTSHKAASPTLLNSHFLSGSFPSLPSYSAGHLTTALHSLLFVAQEQTPFLLPILLFIPFFSNNNHSLPLLHHNLFVQPAILLLSQRWIADIIQP